MLRRCDMLVVGEGPSSVVLNIVSYVGLRQLSRVSKRNNTCRNNGVDGMLGGVSYNQVPRLELRRALVAERITYGHL